MAVPAIGGIGGIGGITPPAAPATGGTSAGGKGGGFGKALSGEIDKLDASQNQASTAAEQLATGKATDISTVAMQVEQASLSLQLAVQVRNKVVDAYNDLFRMQI
jgi:flagellar hook-basal body complex protein FliE